MTLRTSAPILDNTPMHGQAPATSQAEIAARLDRLPATRTIWKFVVLLSFGFFFELYDVLYSGYVAPGLVKSGILTSGANGLFATNSVASFIAALFAGLFSGTIGCGFLADRFGRRTIFTYSLLFYSGANLIMAFQTGAAGLDFWRFVSGIGLGVEMVTIGTYLSELVPKRIRGRAFACEQAIGFASVPIAALLSYLLLPRNPLGLDGWRWVVIIGANSALFVWFIRRQLPESPRWLAQHGRLAEADGVLSKIESTVAHEYRRALPVPSRTEYSIRGAVFRDMWAGPYGKRSIMMIVFHVFQTVGFYGFGNWVPTLLIQQGVTVTSSLMYSFIIAIAAPIGPMIGLFIADKFERKTVIMAASALIAVFGLVFSQVSSAVLLIAMGVALTLANNTLSFSFHAYQTELFPTQIRATAVGFVYSWSRFSAIFTSFLIASTLNAFGTTGVFLFIAGSMAVVILAIGLMGPRTRDLGLETVSQ